MSYQPTSYRKFLATSVTAAAVLATGVAVTPSNVAADVKFSDVSEDYFAAKEIYALVEQEIISGYPDGTFKPGQFINRGQAASILVKAAKLDVPDSVEAAPFNDVSAVNNFARVLTVMKDAEFIGGYPDGTFRAGNDITREQMASILVKTFGLTNTGEEVSVKDLAAAHTSHQENIVILAQAGLTNVETFRPKESVTRAQFATFVDRALKLDSTDQIEEDVMEESTTAVSGFVRNGDNGVEGIKVSVGSKTATTDANGFYHLAGLTAGEHEVTFSKTGFEPKTKKVTLIDEETVSLFVSDLAQLDKTEITVEANVVNKVSGAAITDADIAIEKWNQTTEAFEAINLGEDFSFEAGKISIANASEKLNFGDTLRLQVSRDFAANQTNALHATDWIEFTLKAESAANVLAGIEVTAVEAMTLSGLVKDSEGNELEDATVELHNEDGEFITVTTNENGEYDFKDITIPSGTYSIKVDSADNALYLGQVVVTEGQDASHNVNLVQANELNFTVEALAVNETLNNTNLKAELVQNGAVIAVGTKAADTNTFSFDRIPAGDYKVRVTGDFVLPASFDVAIADQAEATVAGERLTTAGVVTVNTADGSTVNLVKGDEVVAETKENVDGAFTFASVAAGEYKVEVSQSGKVTKSVDATVTKNNTTTKAVELVEVADAVNTANVSGVVRAEGTLAQASAGSVSYYAISVEDKEAGELVAQTAITGGSYSQELAAGVYQVVVRADNFETKVATITVAAGDEITNRNYELTTGGNASLELTFVNEKGEEVEVAEGTVTIADAHADKDAADDAGVKISGDDVAVTFSNLAAGTYSVDVAEQAGKVAFSTTVTIAKGENKELEVVLKDEVVERKSTVSMLVVDEINKNANGSVVAFQDGKLVKVANLTDGAAALELANGSYELRILVDGYKVLKHEVVIDSKDVTVPVMQLKK